MAQINVPKKLEKQFRPLLDTGSIFANVSSVDTKKGLHLSPSKVYILQFQSTTKVHRLESRGGNPLHSISAHLIGYHQKTSYQSHFCPFHQLPTFFISSLIFLTHMTCSCFHLTDLIGVISNVGPYAFVSTTSHKKIRKIQIQDQELVSSAQLICSNLILFFGINNFKPNCREQIQELLLWGEYGETFDETCL